ncbi:acyl-CoA dehydrogenase family protein [Kitasatospora mediocidica]|uniref:acyl-CoA dehydrogenase family protein n=1 Tax=Kitasatospora mediocidica TaxID=58352 RepID=UPI000A88B077|nr:acyl-CoA dehydrogenase family protein [Kitasatospora mediocidica]
MLSTAAALADHPHPSTPTREGLAHATDLARRCAAQVQDQRRLTPELAQALSRAGFARHFVPRRWGGEAGTFETVLARVAALGEECASTAWCAALYAAHGRLAAYLPEAGQREVWEHGPDVRIAAAVNPPTGTARPADGGWRLTGRWSFASGVDHAQWVLLGTRTGPDNEHRILAVRRGDCQVLDTWHSSALRGTGSNTVLLDDLLVPAHRTVVLADLAAARPDHPRCHGVPYPMVAGLQFAAPALGAARAALRAWSRATVERRCADGRRAHESPAAQQVLTRTSAQIEAAALLLRQAALRADAGETGALSVAENIRDAATAVDLCASATAALMRASGARALAQDDPVQRRWLDVAAVANHAALDLEAACAAYARAAFDVHEAARAT